MTSGISNSYYEKLKPYLEELFSHSLRYEKETKTWNAIEQEDVPN